MKPNLVIQMEFSEIKFSEKKKMNENQDFKCRKENNSFLVLVFKIRNKSRNKEKKFVERSKCPHSTVKYE